MRSKINRVPRGYEGTGVTFREMSSALPLVLEKIEQKCGQKPTLILATWPEIIGEKLAAMTKALSFDKGILRVQVDNSTLHSLLVQECKGVLLEKLRKKFPGIYIKDIMFRI